MLDNADLQCLAICDVQASRRENGKRMVDGRYGNKDCVLYRDLRELLARKDIDAVLIATGDRWHTPGSILAAQAGKDVYSEKPCALTIEECGRLGQTMHRYGTVYQAGTQRRSIENFQLAVHLAIAESSARFTPCMRRSTVRMSFTIGLPRSRSHPRKSSIGICGSVRRHGGPTTVNM